MTDIQTDGRADGQSGNIGSRSRSVSGSGSDSSSGSFSRAVVVTAA